MTPEIKIADYDYDLPQERIAKYPLAERDFSKLLLYRQGVIAEERFSQLPELLSPDALLVFNNTKVIRARILFFKETGARIEVFCLEPHDPADYERAFAQTGECSWRCIVGNRKKWKEAPLSIIFEQDGRPVTLWATLLAVEEKECIVRFSWDSSQTFGQLLEQLGQVPIPPYLNRESQELDNTRYQTVYSKFEGLGAAPTAGLHFTEKVIGELREKGVEIREVTLHVGAGTFLPVKSEDAMQHPMHTEHFEVTLHTLKHIRLKMGNVIAVGTTSVRTLESLAVLGYRVLQSGEAQEDTPVGQWEAYEIPAETTGDELFEALVGYLEREKRNKIKSATQIMITPAGFRFRVVSGMITNFHQPKSTLLLLISAFVGEEWRRIYAYALSHGFRFLSYGDSSLLLPGNF